MSGSRLLACALLWMVAAAVHASAAGAAIVLNEINCEATDWVELVNTSDADADVSGWLLTDDPLDSTRTTHRMLFPSATVIPAGGDLVVEKGAGGFPFGISCGDDTIRLADGAGAPVDEVAVPSLAVSADTWGRYPNGTGSWAETVATKGAPNEPSTAGPSPGGDPAAWLFDPGAVVQIDLTLPQASQDALNADSTQYQDATFSLRTTGGTYGPLAVGARLKGGLGSFRPLSGKAAFKVKFNHSVAGQRFLGLKKLTLNNMVQDPSNVHELLAYEAFRAAGVPAPRTGYAYVRVNGQDYGLYLNVETPDDVSLPRWFDSTHHLYEGAYGSDVSVGGGGAFEVDEGSDTDRSDLEALIAAADGEDADWAGRMGSVADLREMTRMWAVEKYIGHWDGYAGRTDALHPNNYFLHSDAAGRFAMLPWGTDQTWEEHNAFDAPAAGLMFTKCLADASCAASYLEAVRDVATVVAGLDLDSQAQATAASLASWQQLDPRREYSLEEIQAGVSATRAFLADRPAEAAAWLDSAAPVDPPSVDPPAAVAAVATVAAPVLAAPDGVALQPPPVTPVPTVSVGRPKAAFGVITTPVGLPGAGRLTQRATIALGRHIRTVCKAAARRAGPGAVTLRCRLSSAARRRLRARSLKVTLHTYFTPLRGRPTALSHRVMLPRA